MGEKGRGSSIESLDPLPMSERTWRWHTYVILWTTMAGSPAMYSFGGSVVALGLNLSEAMACLGIGGVISAVLIVMNSIPGVVYGIPFPVYARSAYGMNGAKYAALSRGVVGIMWTSFITWQSADSLLQGFARAWPVVGDGAVLWEPYLNTSQLIALLLVALMYLGMGRAGLHRFENIINLLAPVSISVFVLVSIWTLMPSWGGVGFDAIFHTEAQQYDTGDVGAADKALAWLAGINATISLWSTLILNMVDLSRLAASQRDQVCGQLLGLPLPMFFTAGVGVMGALTVQAKTGASSWQMNDLFPFWSAPVAALGGIFVLVANIPVNVGCNIIPYTNDLVNLCPSRLQWRKCAYAGIVVGVLICPFYIFDSAEGFALRFLGGYGMVTGAIYGVMVSDYYIVRRGRLCLEDLYATAPETGACAYSGGHNWRAIVATLAGIALPLPDWFAGLVGIEGLPVFWSTCGKLSWFIASVVSLIVYVAACFISTPPPMGTVEGATTKDVEAAAAGDGNLVVQL